MKPTSLTIKYLIAPSAPDGLIEGALTRGYDVTGVDPQYNLSLKEIETKGTSDLESTLKLAQSDLNHADTHANIASLGLPSLNDGRGFCCLKRLYDSTNNKNRKNENSNQCALYLVKLDLNCA